jgi:acyl carrier protein
VREDVPGENRLVAYVIPNVGQAPTTNNLRNFLKSKLPDYMMPSIFVTLDALPLTPNRKVDRRALPPPDGSRSEMEEAFVAPRTPVEVALAGIWAEVLGVERVGIHDNFFELGGHSLLATQVISRVRSAFQIELPLRTLFESPTVAGLAVQIAKVQAQPEELAVILAHLESLSVEEAQRLLADDGESSGKESKHDG